MMIGCLTYSRILLLVIDKIGHRLWFAALHTDTSVCYQANHDDDDDDGDDDGDDDDDVGDNIHQ